MQANIFRKIGKELYLSSNWKMRSDIKTAFQKALRSEKTKLARMALEVILKNAQLASKEKLPLCQDTGYPVFFIKMGRTRLEDIRKLEQGLTLGIKDATLEGPLRWSLVSDPLSRKKIMPNIPPVFHYERADINGIEITLLVKGFGSENQTALYMLEPTCGKQKIADIVIERVKQAGSRACPPYIIGIGIGGTSEQAVLLSKKATLLNVNSNSRNSDIAKLEKEIKEKVNKLGIGPLGVGGKTTALGVRILTHPTHIAGLPVAVTLGCHSTRSARIKLRI
jgi:fumarate hydratase subunit alpha